MDASPTPTPSADRLRQGRQWIVTAVIAGHGLVWAALSGILWWLRRDRLPTPFAVEHLPTGGALVAGTALAYVAVLGGASVLVALAGAWGAGADRRDTTRRRVFAALATGWPVFLCGTALAALDVQTDVRVATAAPTIAFPVAMALCLGSLLGGLAAAGVVPRRGRAAAVAASSGGDGLRWRGAAAGVSLVSLAVPALVQLLAFVAAIVQKSASIPLVLAVASSALLLHRVRHGHPQVLVGDDGVRLILGQRTRAFVPAGDLVEATAEDCRPLRDAGGYGLRVGRGGRIGWVTRRGPALRIRRAFGGDVLVSIDDPEEAVAAIEAVTGRPANGDLPGESETDPAAGEPTTTSDASTEAA